MGLVLANELVLKVIWFGFTKWPTANKHSEKDHTKGENVNPGTLVRQTLKNFWGRKSCGAQTKRLKHPILVFVLWTSRLA